MRFAHNLMLCICLALLVFIASVHLIDPTGPTTIGREYAPFAFAFWAFIVSGGAALFDYIREKEE